VKIKVFAINSPYDEEYTKHFWCSGLCNRAIWAELGERTTFSTNDTPSGLLGASKTSREVLLKHWDGQISLNHGGIIRFNRNHDTILLYDNGKRGTMLALPGVIGNPQSHRNYKKMFSDVKTLALDAYDMERATEDRIWLISQFPGLQTLITLSNRFYPTLESPSYYSLCKSNKKMRLRTVEEIYGPLAINLRQYSYRFEIFEDMCTRIKDDFASNKRGLGETKWPDIKMMYLDTWDTID